MNCKKFMLMVLKSTKSINLYEFYKICLKGYEPEVVNKDFNNLLKYNDNIILKDGIIYYNI